VPLARAPFQPGDLLDGRFFITELLSRSGAGTVFKAEDTHDHNRLVAVKVPHEEGETDPAFLSRFEREERIGVELNHPFLLKFVPVPGKKSRPYLVTEYLKGCTLEHLLRAIRPLPEKDALKIASLVCEALQYLHDRRIIHRDLKPQNIMICCDGSIRIMDFGIARKIGSRPITLADPTSSMGTADYMAPEQVEGGRGDERTDIYNLGAVLYELLTGVTLFPHQNEWVAMNARVKSDPASPRAINPALSPQAEEIVLRALQRDPAQRYPTARAMKMDLDRPGQVKLTGLAQQAEELRRGGKGWRAAWSRAAAFGRSVLAGSCAWLLLLAHHLVRAP